MIHVGTVNHPYYRARYYDPATGRFISEDPSDFGGGLNFYVYVANDPANWFDPFGLERMSLADIANLVAKSNKSGQSNELIICMAYKESNFDPDASRPGNQSATGLMGVTDAAATQVGVDYDDLGDRDQHRCWFELPRVENPSKSRKCTERAVGLWNR